MSLQTIELTGNETDEQCRDIAWQMFCAAYPVEAHHSNPDGFWEYFRKRVPNVSREHMVRMLKECEKETLNLEP